MPADKITSRNLSYDQTLPPFLARLHGQHNTSSRNAPDPVLAARRRPAVRVRSTSEEAEDAPLVVDEFGNEVSSETAHNVGHDNDKGFDSAKTEGNKEMGEDAGGEDEDREEKRAVGIGSKRKRKVGRLVGDRERERERDKEEQNPSLETDVSRAVEKSRALLAKSGEHRESDRSAPTLKIEMEGPRGGKKGGRAKKIKLSFGDEEG